MSKFSSTLRELRTKKGYTQKYLAELIGVSESTIGMYERGEREPNFETLELIADILNVYMSDLIEKKPTDYSGLTDEEKKLLTIFKELSADDRDLLKKQAELLIDRRKK